MRWTRTLPAAGLAALLAASPAHAETLIGLAAPMTGSMAWFGEQHQEALEAAAPEFESAEQVIGEDIHVMIVDDFCNGEQAVAAAHKLVEAGVVFVGGHACSGAAIPASAVYEEAGVLMISSTATNPLLTERGLELIFRVVERDTKQAVMVADRLAEHGPEANIAIVHDGEAYGQGLAEATEAVLSAPDKDPVIFDGIEPGRADYGDLLDRLEASEIEALFFSGYPTEAGLVIRQARARGQGFEMIGIDSLSSEYFWHLAGEAAEGVLFPSTKELRDSPDAASVVARFRDQGFEPEGFTLYNFAVFEVWSKAVQQAGSADPETVARTLRENTFDTVLGKIGFDANGDVTGTDSFAWYVWKDDTYVPLDPMTASD
jgi:branched-chain amino acid transport system substrate-binding protein